MRVAYAAAGGRHYNGMETAPPKSEAASTLERLGRHGLKCVDLWSHTLVLQLEGLDSPFWRFPHGREGYWTTKSCLNGKCNAGIGQNWKFKLGFQPKLELKGSDDQRPRFN